MNKEYYVDKRGKKVVVDFDVLKSYMDRNNKIGLIKEFRAVSNMGLKDAKDAIEQHSSSFGYDNEAMFTMFREYTTDVNNPFTKEEFMSLIEQAVDTMEEFHFTDMIEAVEVMFANVKKKGGLIALAEHRDKFLNNI